jgi:hypothetical protein
MPEDELRRMAKELLGIREITRVSLAVNQEKHPLCYPNKKLKYKVELTGVETRDFSSLKTLHIPNKTLKRILKDYKRLKIAQATTVAIGEKPGMTTERH